MKISPLITLVNQVVSNSRNEWSPIRSIIIRVITKIERPLRGSPICILRVFFFYLLRQVCHNLISNAVKYTSKHKCVYISLKIINSVLFLKIKDEGIGIPLEDQKTLFEPFIRGTNTEDIRGTGLGLSIVKSAVTKLNGKISFNSSCNGSEFTVEIPSLWAL